MKPLIYFSVGDREEYVELLELNLQTLVGVGYTGDIMIIVDELFKTKIQQRICIPNAVHYHVVKNYSVGKLHNAATNKLLLFEFAGINNYDKIIFCDVDALWLNNPEKMFDVIDDQHVSFGGGFFVNYLPLMSDPLNYWGADMLDEQERNAIEQQHIIAANTGIFGLSSTTAIFLKEVLQYMQQNVDKIGPCIEQPFLNVMAWRRNKYNLALEKHAYNGAARSDFAEDYKNNTQKYENLCVVHFANGVGKFDSKISMMRSFFAQLTHH